MAQKNRGVHADRLWREAINKAVHELVDDPDNPRKVKALGLIARKVVEKALDGDMMAVQEIGNRLDGRAPQTIKANVDHTVSAVSEDEMAKANELLARIAPTTDDEAAIH